MFRQIFPSRLTATFTSAHILPFFGMRGRRTQRPIILPCLANSPPDEFVVIVADPFRFGKPHLVNRLRHFR